MEKRPVTSAVALSLILSASAAAQDSTKPASPTSTTATSPTPPTAPAAVPPRRLDGGDIVEQLREEASRVMPLVKCECIQRFLINTSWLPVVEPRTVYWDKGRSALTKEQYEALAEDKRVSYKALELDEEYYFYTRFGSPLAYARPLDIIAKSFGCKDMCLIKKKILDFGYGGIGHLRLLANNGARVTGVEVDPILAALYSKPGDTGTIAGVGVSENKPPAGTLTLVTGQWPADAATVSKVGDGYDLIISKNVLKNGYIHPEKEVPKGMLIDLGVDDAAFLKAVANTLNPDGFFLIYNICPAQKPDKYIPWADGRCPFTKEAIAAAGLEALEYNVDDSGEARLLGKALKWDEGDSPMDLTRDCFAWYTLIHKPVTK